MIGPGKTLSDALFKPGEPLPLRSRLFRNDLQVAADGTRTLKFTDVTEQSGIDARGYGMGVATGDIDNDGWVDLFLTYLGTNQLYRNNGNGTFTDVSASSGIDAPGWGVSASFLDYDRDGWLDLYVGNYVRYSVTNDRTCTVHVGPEKLLRARAVRPADGPSVSQPWEWHVRRRHREGVHRIGAVRAGTGCRNRGFQQRRLAGYLRRERRSGEPVVDQPAEWHVQDRGVAVGRGSERAGQSRKPTWGSTPAISTTTVMKISS